MTSLDINIISICISLRIYFFPSLFPRKIKGKKKSIFIVFLLFSVKTMVYVDKLSDVKNRFYSWSKVICENKWSTVYSGTKCDAENTPVAIKIVSDQAVKTWCKHRNREIGECGRPEYGSELPKEICCLREGKGVPGVISMLDWYYVRETSQWIIVMHRPKRHLDLYRYYESLANDLNVFYTRCTGKEGRIQRNLALMLLWATGEMKDILSRAGDSAVRLLKRGVVCSDMKQENIVVDMDTNKPWLVDMECSFVGRECVHYPIMLYTTNQNKCPEFYTHIHGRDNVSTSTIETMMSYLIGTLVLHSTNAELVDVLDAKLIDNDPDERDKTIDEIERVVLRLPIGKKKDLLCHLLEADNTSLRPDVDIALRRLRQL